MADTLLAIADSLSRSLAGITFSRPVTHVYNPTAYAREPFRNYLERFGNSPGRVVLVGMNPGPWGMVQTGVPFGEISFVRGWMGIEGKVGQPVELHPKRPVEGFRCTRREVSGRRLWGWARVRFGSAERFFRHFFVLNYCPLAFFDKEGKNLTPDRLKSMDKIRLYRLCDGALRDSVRLLTPDFAIGIGRFAQDRTSAALEGMNVETGRMTHPSPANPAANRGWEEVIEKELGEMGIDLSGG
jgi:single-strand selective monofunctional uracil DNA glycosylase